MRLYLKNQTLIPVPVELAQEIGFLEAALLRALDTWIAQHGDQNQTLTASLSQIRSWGFSFVSRDTLNRTLHSLERMSLITITQDGGQRRIALNPNGFAYLNSALLVDDIESDTQQNLKTLAATPPPPSTNGKNAPFAVFMARERVRQMQITAPDLPLYQIATSEEWLDEMKISDPARARILVTDTLEIVAWILYANAQKWSTNPAALVILGCLEHRNIPPPFLGLAQLTLDQWWRFANHSNISPDEAEAFHAFRSVYQGKTIPPWGLEKWPEPQ